MVKNLKLEHKNLQQKTYESIKDMILLGELAPNERLKEEKIAKELGVSRTTVNSAILRLKSEYLLEDTATRGVRVRISSVEENIEAFDVREVLEGLSAKIAARRMDDKTVETLINRFKSFIGSGLEFSNPDFSRLNFDMHQQIADCHLNKTVPKSIISFLMQHRFFIASHRISFEADSFESLIQDHIDILEAIKSSKEEDAEALMRKHIRSVKNTFIEMYQVGQSQNDNSTIII